MRDKFIIPKSEDGSGNQSLLAIDVSLKGMSTVYQSNHIEKELVTKLRELALGKSINTRDFKHAQGLGASGASLMQLFIDFYHSHTLLVLTLGKIPLILNTIRKSLEIITSCYYFIFNKVYTSRKKQYHDPFNDSYSGMGRRLHEQLSVN